MRRIAALLGSLALIFTLSPAATVAGPPETSADRIPGSWIVTLADNVDASTNAPRLARQAGGSVGFIYEHALNGFSFAGSDAAAAALARNPGVVRVEADGAVWLVETEQRDPTWGLDRIDDRSGLDKSYWYAYDGTGVKAYIIDTGIDIGHREFGTRASYGYDSVDRDTTADDCHGHGTHVAGTVGGSTYGVAKDVRLVAVRVLDCNGSGSWSGVIAGIDWVTGNAAKPAVANMSLGGGGNSSVDEAVQRSIASGVSYAVAAGNGNMVGIAQDACKYSPARTPEAMTIGATDDTDTKASWSNYGGCVDWFAPGVTITSAWIGSGDNETRNASGTSMASPHTAGAAALYLEANPAATPQQVRDALYGATTKDIVKSSKTVNSHLLYSRFDLLSEAIDTTQPPVADAGADVPDAAEDVAVSFDGTGSSDLDGDGLSYAWNFGDGSPTATGATASHTYLWGGTFTVTLTVTDGSGQSDDDTATVTVSEVNDRPVAEAGGPYSGATASTITFDASDSTDYDNADGTSANTQTLAYTWDFGDGSATKTGAVVTHAYTSEGDYLATVTVSDGTHSHSDSATVKVSVTSTTMHVADLDDAGSINNGSTWTARVTVTVHDGNHLVVTGATVRGTFTFDTGEVFDTCTTTSSGTCDIFGSGIPKKNGSATLTLTAVTVADASLAYQSGDNHDPDSDSRGHWITVLKP